MIIFFGLLSLLMNLLLESANASDIHIQKRYDVKPNGEIIRSKIIRKVKPVEIIKINNILEFEAFENLLDSRKKINYHQVIGFIFDFELEIFPEWITNFVNVRELSIWNSRLRYFPNKILNKLSLLKEIIFDGGYLEENIEFSPSLANTLETLQLINVNCSHFPDFQVLKKLNVLEILDGDDNAFDQSKINMIPFKRLHLSNMYLSKFPHPFLPNATDTLEELHFIQNKLNFQGLDFNRLLEFSKLENITITISGKDLEALEYKLKKSRFLEMHPYTLMIEFTDLSPLKLNQFITKNPDHLKWSVLSNNLFQDLHFFMDHKHFKGQKKTEPYHSYNFHTHEFYFPRAIDAVDYLLDKDMSDPSSQTEIIDLLTTEKQYKFGRIASAAEKRTIFRALIKQADVAARNSDTLNIIRLNLTHRLIEEKIKLKRPQVLAHLELCSKVFEAALFIKENDPIYQLEGILIEGTQEPLLKTSEISYLNHLYDDEELPQSWKKQTPDFVRLAKSMLFPKRYFHSYLEEAGDRIDSGFTNASSHSFKSASSSEEEEDRIG